MQCASHYSFQAGNSTQSFCFWWWNQAFCTPEHLQVHVLSNRWVISLWARWMRGIWSPQTHARTESLSLGATPIRQNKSKSKRKHYSMMELGDVSCVWPSMFSYRYRQSIDANRDWLSTGKKGRTSLSHVFDWQTKKRLAAWQAEN